MCDTQLERYNIRHKNVLPVPLQSNRKLKQTYQGNWEKDSSAGSSACPQTGRLVPFVEETSACVLVAHSV